MGVRRKLHECGHKSFGQRCHRCAQAERLETDAAGLGKGGELKAHMLTEAARLRVVPVKAAPQT